MNELYEEEEAAGIVGQGEPGGTWLAVSSIRHRALGHSTLCNPEIGSKHAAMRPATLQVQISVRDILRHHRAFI
jgi:hypothetical protein